MADNIRLNPGSGGDQLAADEISSVKHQRMKVQYGTPGNATDVSTSNPLPVTLSGTAIELTGAPEVTLASGSVVSITGTPEVTFADDASIAISGNVNLETRTAFGEYLIAQLEPYIEARPTYDLVPANFRTFTAVSGTAGVEDRMFKTSTGTAVGGYGAVQSFRNLNYRAGQGARARFTAIFESNTASSWQGVGFISIADEFSFGYNGTDFGIWHRYGGIAEVRNIKVTVPAGGSETLTLTLNGAAYSIPLTSGTVNHNAYEIADWINNDAVAGGIWRADSLGENVIISALSDGSKSGSYSYSSSGASTGTITQSRAGVTKTSTHTPQSSWNGSSVTFNPALGNVYQIAYQYLGFGQIEFCIENPSTGYFETVHRIKYANTSTTPSILNPSLKLGMYCVSLGSTTDLVVRSASMAAFVDGKNARTRNPRSEKNSQTVSTSFTNILTIKNRATYNNYINQQEFIPVNLTVANESSKNIEVELRANSSFADSLNFSEVGNDLFTDVDTTATTTSGGRLLAAFTVAGSSSELINLNELEITIPPTLTLTVAARVTSGASSTVTAALVWYEDL